MLFWICFSIIFIPMIIFFPIKRVGKKNLKELKGKNYIVSCNHMSNYDPVLLDIKMGKKFRYLAKKELFKSKLGAFFLRAYGGVPVDRKNVDPTSIKEVLRLIQKGKKVAIFPQGTRKPTPKIEDGSVKEGVAMFSIRTGTPVVPMMFSRKIKPFRFVKLYIGKPIYPDETRKKDKEYLAEYSNLIVEKMNELLEGENKHENERL